MTTTYGPNTAAVEAMLSTIESATDDQIEALSAARAAARPDARWAAQSAAQSDARWAARSTARWAARWAAQSAARWAAQSAARSTARWAAYDAIDAAVVWDLATADGPFTFAHRDLLIAPWESVFGLPEGLN